MPEQLVFEERDGVAWITLNRPEVHNALSMQLSDELIQAIEHVRDQRAIRFLVLTGAGGTFCSGDDITEMASFGNANDVMRRVRGYQRMANELEELDKITIAAVDGYAVGGGLELTMACDFVLATERARWGMPEVDVGLTPGWGGTARLARLVGMRMAKEVNLIGALRPSRRAVELGLWNRVVPDDALESEVHALLEVLSVKNQQAMRQIKFILQRGANVDVQSALGYEALSSTLTAAVSGAWQIEDADQASGLMGFVNKDGLWGRRRSLSAAFWSDER